MKSIKSEFRRIFGYDPTHICKECKYCEKHVANRTHYKCSKMGVTSSAATDIRLKDYSCRLFDPEEG